jgi:hypothetical protein
MKLQQLVGRLLIAGAVGIFVPYLVLTLIFNYPLVLREDAGDILKQFHAGGALLIGVWLAFAMMCFPLLIAYFYVGELTKMNVPYMKLATILGMVSGVVQIIGLLRWVFVVPVLAHAYTHNTNPAVLAAIKVSFMVIHQFGGVLLGEHLGQLLTVVWTVMAASALQQQGFIPNWVKVLGIAVSGVYFLAQADLLATVIPDFPTVPLAGLLGSTLWLFWLVIAGNYLLQKR